MEQTLLHLRLLADFAYQQGFHELGYDPVADVGALTAKVHALLAAMHVSHGSARKMRGIWFHSDSDEVSLYDAVVSALGNAPRAPSASASDSLAADNEGDCNGKE